MSVGDALRRAEERLRTVANPETGECPLDDTICPNNDNSKFREAIVKEVLLAFFRHEPRIVKEILREIGE